ncbi:hypothetical protein [Pseudomonas lundensis]|uniref:hypothetical protein n=1 Tax=Pseudomonas lundensis TaxID=86185 RepID=UPI000641F977|nr:hypothetical protein [Pseudomonas lundensis]NLT99752.1 hypothetical protein [Pseudomonas lundensis]NNA02371.1 hypothetical protein [Pseudomonas lundensis]NNA30142.1 hypothetical protein [Pseudomonas lundensis]NNA39384.1 hypothetical protein [Pseudomonas lundensis]
MSTKVLRGDISLHKIPFQFQRHYVWTIQLFILQADGVRKQIGFISEPTSIREPWDFAFHFDDDHVPESVAHYVIRVEVLDGSALVADADHNFSAAWQNDAPSTQHLVLEPQAI